MSFGYLRMRQVEERVAPLREAAKQPVPKSGRIKAMRQALSMSTSQLASRLGVSRQAVRDLEIREVDGGVTLSALKRAADAMECDILYALVPRKPIMEVLEDRARAIATERLGRISHSMHLEAQGVSSEEFDREVEDLAALILREMPRELWSEEEEVTGE